MICCLRRCFALSVEKVVASVYTYTWDGEDGEKKTSAKKPAGVEELSGSADNSRSLTNKLGCFKAGKKRGVGEKVSQADIYVSDKGLNWQSPSG